MALYLNRYTERQLSVETRMWSLASIEHGEQFGRRVPHDADTVGVPAPDSAFCGLDRRQIGAVINDGDRQRDDGRQDSRGTGLAGEDSQGAAASDSGGKVGNDRLAPRPETDSA